MSTHGINNSNHVEEDEMLREERKQEVLPQVLPISLLIVLTNIVVVILFCSKPGLRKAPNYLLFSLAICDFLNGSLNIPLFIMIFIPVVDRAKRAGLVCAMEVSHNFIAITAACHIFLITAERYMAVLRPLKYHVIKKKTVFLAIAGAWLISALVAAAPIGWFSLRFGKDRIGLVLETTFNVFCLLAVFVAPYTFIIYAYVAMFRKVRKRNPNRNNRNSSKTRKKKRNECKCLIVFATMATVFALCWLPWFALRLIFSLVGQRLITLNYGLGMEIAANVTIIVRYLTSVINPLLYTFFKQDFWRALKRTVLKKIRDVKSSSSESRPKKRSTKKMMFKRSNQSNSAKSPDRAQIRQHLSNQAQVV